MIRYICDKKYGHTSTYESIIYIKRTDYIE